MGKNTFTEALKGLGIDDCGDLEAMFSGAAFGIYIDHPTQGCIFANQTLLAYWDVQWEQFSGFQWTSYVHPNDIPSLQEAVRRYEHELHVLHHEYRIVVGPREPLRWIRAQVRPLLGEGGHHIGSLGIIVDITKERQVAAYFAHNQALEAVGQLSGRIAHDFNNLLGVALASVDLMDNAAPKELKELQTTVRDCVEHSAQITKQLLTLAGQQDNERRQEVLDDEIRLLEPLLSRVGGEGLQIQYSLDAPNRIVGLSKSQIGQIAVNLVSNARDAMDGRGKLRIVTECNATDVTVRFEDEGTGMGPAAIANYHKPFFTTKAPGRGTGLGMSIVQDLVDATSGQIGIQSQLGYGTQISIQLPILGTNDFRPHDRTTAYPPRTSGESILLVEDNTALRQSLAVSLALYGYRVKTADSLQADRNQLKKAMPSIIVTDVLLPDGCGHDLISDIHKIKPEMPVLYISGFADLHQPLGLAATNIRFLQKPFSANTLICELMDMSSRARILVKKMPQTAASVESP